MITERRPRSRATTAEQDARMRQAAEENPLTTAVLIQQQLQLQVSVDTVRRRLHEGGIHHRIPAKKETLTDQHRAGRLAFAEANQDKDLHYWSRVIYSDEKTFCSHSHGRRHVWRRDNTR